MRNMQVVSDIERRQPIVWPLLPHRHVERILAELSVKRSDMEDAHDRWTRFSRLLMHLFPELLSSRGQIDSPLLPINSPDLATSGYIFAKCDHDLPITGCIKARGGFYEVLLTAEQIALQNGILDPGADPICLTEPEARKALSRYRIVVGSTGNLGYSVGLIAKALGFMAEVHMSADAKGWKKKRLREHGVTVIEHAGDYSEAVANARRAAQKQLHTHFIDDENSLALFLGYSVGALDLERQLKQAGVEVSARRPLFVYLPCGVGGAPGGLTFGLRHVFGEHVYPVFVEPTGAPCMTLQLASGEVDRVVPVSEIGLSVSTSADGLAVGGASLLAANLIQELVSVCVTLDDTTMKQWVVRAWREYGLRLEPSAAAAFAAVEKLRDFRSAYDTSDVLPSTEATHVAWTTGGSLLPDDVFLKEIA